MDPEEGEIVEPTVQDTKATEPQTAPTELQQTATAPSADTPAKPARKRKWAAMWGDKAADTEPPISEPSDPPVASQPAAGVSGESAAASAPSSASTDGQMVALDAYGRIITPDNDGKARKKSRWGAEDERLKDIPPEIALLATAAGLTPLQTEMFVLKTRLDQLQQKLLNPLVEYYRDRPRSPSPDPVYDNNGRRVNTRINRITQRLTKERNDLQQQLIKVTKEHLQSQGIDPATVSGMNLPKQKFEKRITIPLDKYPDYNFKGVIIGPRGQNQQRLEKETGCHISVRGKGARLKKPGQAPMPDDDEPQFVFIQADSEDKLEKGVAEIEKLLIPMSEEERKRQLKAVMIINGTWRPVTEPCKICGEDHRIYECPHRSSNWKPADVVCEVCGDKSHITRDCPRMQVGAHAPAIGGNVGSAAGALPMPQQTFAQEFESFLSEIGQLGSGSTLSRPLALTDGSVPAPGPASAPAPAAHRPAAHPSAGPGPAAAPHSGPPAHHGHAGYPPPHAHGMPPYPYPQPYPAPYGYPQHPQQPHSGYGYPGYPSYPYPYPYSY